MYTQAFRITSTSVCAKSKSFCLLSGNADHINRCKYDVHFMIILGVDIGEWKFPTKATAIKMIGDRYRLIRINQSILNSLLEYNLDDNQVKFLSYNLLEQTNNY